MSTPTHVVFDLDGTLTDPVEGITRCIRYALDGLSLPAPSRGELASYIGPPLRQTFSSLCHTSDPAIIEHAVLLYRERLARIGLYENEVYPGIDAMLDSLRSLGCSLFIATSKPQIFAEKILAHFSLDRYFVAIHGSELDGRLDDKALLVRELVERHALPWHGTVMVGDRRYDITAAIANRLRSIGVTYGYGSSEELLKAGAHLLCNTPGEVAASIADAGLWAAHDT